MNKKTYSSIELFAGAGGLALGLEKAGFESKALVEIDKWAVATLRKNRPEWQVIAEDIRKINEQKITSYIQLDSELDLLSGGYPCQAFSYAGKRLGLEDTRGTLFYDFAEMLNHLKPKVLLAENVKGLLSHDKGQTLETMLNVFEDMGYVVRYNILNALNYNVAQKRERLIIVGIRKDIHKKIGKDYEFPAQNKKRLYLKDILKDVPKSQGTTYSENKKKILNLVPQGGCWRDLPDEIAKEYMGASYFLGGGKTGMARRLSWDEPSLTILCSPSQKQTERCHPDETRPLTIRESARIQSFPDDWIFEGSVSEQYKQIGNAVPVELGKAIGLSIKNYLDQLDSE